MSVSLPCAPSHLPRSPSSLRTIGSRMVRSGAQSLRCSENSFPTLCQEYRFGLVAATSLCRSFPFFSSSGGPPTMRQYCGFILEYYMCFQPCIRPSSSTVRVSCAVDMKTRFLPQSGKQRRDSLRSVVTNTIIRGDAKQKEKEAPRPPRYIHDLMSEGFIAPAIVCNLAPSPT